MKLLLGLLAIPLFAQGPMLRAPTPCVAAGGSTTAYTCTPSPAITAYVTHQPYFVTADVANTTAATWAISGLAAKAVVKNVGGAATALVANDIRAGAELVLTYDGTRFQCNGCDGNAPASSGASLLDYQNLEAAVFAATATDQIVAATTLPAIPAGKCVNVWIEFALSTGTSASATVKWNLGGTGAAHATISGGTALTYNAFSGTPNPISAGAKVCNDPATQATNQINSETLFQGSGVASSGSFVATAVDLSVAQQLSLTINISATFNLRKRAWQVILVQ